MVSKIFHLKISALLCLVGVINGQEKLGIVNSNYSPVNSIFLNPSFSADSKTYMQLKFAGLSAFVMTNAGYIPSTSLWSFRAAGEGPLPQPAEGTRNRFAFLTAAAEGPCFVMSKNLFGAGIFVRGRSILNVRRLPHQFTSLVLGQEPIGPDRLDVDLKNGGFANLTWLEIGGNFSYIISRSGPHLWQAGINVSYLMGYNALYANLKELRGFYNDSVLDVQRLDGRIFYNTPRFNSGRGLATDVGIVYKKMLGNIDHYLAHAVRSNCAIVDYKYRIGLSLRDAGFVKVNSGVVDRRINGAGYLSIEQERGTFTRITETNVELEESTAPVRVFLPLTASLQFDYNFENNIYLAGVFVKNMVPAGLPAVQGHDLLAVIPRVEFKNIEVALPFTMHRYVYPRLGFAFRVRSLVLGVDNVFPLLMRTNVNTVGLYANLSVSLFRNPACRFKCRAVDDCMPRLRSARQKGAGFFRTVFGRKKTYRK